MSNTAPAITRTDVQLGVRLPLHLVEAIDAKLARMQAMAPGVVVTRSDALRALLLLGISADPSA